MSAAEVRPEYEALARHLRALAGQFDLAIDAPLERDLILVAASFEVIDRRVDAIADEAARLALCGAIVHRLRDDDRAHALPDDLHACLLTLRARLDEVGATAAFAASLARFFEETARLRATTGAREFVGSVLGEAQRAAEMVLLVAAPLRVARFERFFVVLAETANLVDKLHDVRDDRRRGEIALDAGLALHLALLVAFVSRGVRLLASSPRPLGLVAWGARYLRAPSPAAAEHPVAEAE